MPRKKIDQPNLSESDSGVDLHAAHQDSVADNTKQKTRQISQRPPYSPFTLIADIGRSSCKNVVFSGQKLIEGVKLSSIVKQLNFKPEHQQGGFTVHLEIPTEEKDENGKLIKIKRKESWLVGERACSYADAIVIEDGKFNDKVEYFHILLCGVISTIPNLYDLSTGANPKKRTLSIDLTTLSIAPPEQLREKLTQCKKLEKDGVVYNLRFTNNKHGYPEGYGASFAGKKHFNQTKLIVADLGAGTFQITQYTTIEKPQKSNSDNFYSGGGMHSAKEMISESLSATSDGSKFYDDYEIDSILRSSQWIDGKVIAEDFDKKPIGEAIELGIANWLRISPARHSLKKLITLARHTPVVFCGGGFEIPAIRGIVEKRILDSGANPNNLLFPENMGLLGVMGIYEYFHNTHPELNKPDLHVIKSEGIQDEEIA